MSSSDYLLDTVTLSEMRKRNPVVRWFTERDEASLFISAVSVGEIERGAALKRPRDALFADALTRWLERLLVHYEDRIIPVDTRIARCWGRLGATIGHMSADLLIAATALERDLTVVTRNIRHFAPAGVPVENPFV
ncbi:MAG TPA: type II toxin-antitoxin system VapC family toxin [Stellaceae bacterium]|jgi:hypothetical protein